MPPRLFLPAGSALVRYQLTAAVGYQLADIVRYLLADAVGNQFADIVGYLLADAVGFGLWILWPVTPASPRGVWPVPGTERAAIIIAAVNASAKAMSTARARITSWKSCVSII